RRQLDAEVERLARGDPPLREEVPRVARPADAEVGDLDRPHRRARTEGDLHALVEVSVELDVTGTAVLLHLQVRELSRLLRGSLAGRADEVPAHLEEAVLRRVEEDAEDLEPVEAPVPRDREGPEPRELAVGGRPDRLLELGEEVRGEAEVGEA